MKYTHDVIVIGGGAAGLTAAGGCGLFGLEVALIEAGEMGGECLNTGCVPSKALIAAARRAAEIKGPARLGVGAIGPHVDWAGVSAHVAGAIAAIAPHDAPERFEGMGCEVIRHPARLNGPNEVLAGERVLRAPRLVLALGSEPALPPIAGLAEVPFLTNETLFTLAEQPDHLLIVGGGAMGMEMAQSFARLGSAVTLIEPEPLLAREDREAAALVQASLEADGVRFVSARALGVSGRPGAIRLETDGAGLLSGSHLLLATGRRARGAGIGLEQAGVRCGANGILVDARRRTSVKSIYAIGDCRDGPRLTHVAGYEGSRVVTEIALGLPSPVDWRALPWCTYTDPELAQIGLTEAAARARYGAAIQVVREDFSHNDRALTEGRGQGFLKVMLRGRKVVGATICGAQAGELLLPFSQMITGSASTFALGSAILAYPSLSEISKAAAFSAWEPMVFGAAPKRWARLLARIRRGL